jgi:hypothetical protein
MGAKIILGHKDIIITKAINVNISLCIKIPEYPQVAVSSYGMPLPTDLATGTVTGRSSRPLYDYSTFTVPVPIWFQSKFMGCNERGLTPWFNLCSIDRYLFVLRS